MKTNPLLWLSTSPPQARKALFAASLGWMLDSFDVMLYSLVLASLIVDLHLSRRIPLMDAGPAKQFFGVPSRSAHAIV